MLKYHQESLILSFSSCVHPGGFSLKRAKMTPPLRASILAATWTGIPSIQIAPIKIPGVALLGWLGSCAITELMTISLIAQAQILGIEEPHPNPQGGRGCSLEEVLSPHARKGDVGCAEWQLPHHRCPEAPGRNCQNDS